MTRLRFDLSGHTGYAFNPIDRLSAHRDDVDFVRALYDDATTRFVVIGRDRPIVKAGGLVPAPLHTLAEADAIAPARETVLLGRTPERAIFAVLIDDDAIAIQESVSASGLFDTRRQIVPGRPDLMVRDLRGVTTEGLLDDAQIGFLGQAKSVMYWHVRHRFCGVCGGRTHSASAGWRRDCTACGAQQFPRTDPVVIMLAVHGEDCLLGRSPRFNAGMYSALAGFLEPGETIEDAVRREILEESGIACGAVGYVASQPWPFPGSLMIGCVAQALNRDIVVDTSELEDCRWFARDEVDKMIRRVHPDGLEAPNPIAIAHHLVRAWRDGEARLPGLA